jgi:hypothetical protein
VPALTFLAAVEDHSAPSTLHEHASVNFSINLLHTEPCEAQCTLVLVGRLLVDQVSVAIQPIRTPSTHRLILHRHVPEGRYDECNTKGDNRSQMAHRTKVWAKDPTIFLLQSFTKSTVLSTFRKEGSFDGLVRGLACDDK